MKINKDTIERRLRSKLRNASALFEGLLIGLASGFAIFLVMLLISLI